MLKRAGLKVNFVDFHHHTPDKRLGIYIGTELETLHAAGIHPWQVKKNFDEQKLKKNLLDPLCLGLGEVGLDKTKEHFKQQIHLLQNQLELAKEVEVNYITFHNVKATDELYSCLGNINYQGVVHLHDFSGGFEAFKQWDKKFKTIISSGPRLLRSTKTQDLMKIIPSRQFFLESDNSTIDIASIYNAASAMLKTEIDQLSKEIHRNFTELLTFIKNKENKGNQYGCW